MFLIGAVLIFNFLENRRLLNMSKEESKILKMNLMEKESHLSQLKSEIAKQKKKPSEALLMKIQNLESEIENLRKQEADDKQEYLAGADYHIFEGIVYKSRGMDKIVDIIKRVAPENASVLITGESGSGKELIAKAIHNLSKRKDSNFVAVNCAALPENLLESELFGHVKGAFTGAVNDKAGRFQEADKGTLFLDEIGETTDNFQAKLLRVIQSGEFQKVGSSKTDKVDVRIVTATNKNLSRSIKENRFREDLFYRLNVINIDLPPLSERSEDISVIADYFVKKEDPDLSISRAVMNKLSENEWKGNIRELESVIKRAVIFAKTDNRKIVMLKDLPEPMSKISKDDMETLVLQSLRNKKFSHSSITETADELSGVSRTVVSENFRGILFRAYTENSFDIKKTVETVSASSEIDVLNKVNSKLVTYLSNLDKDLEQIKDLPFEDIKRNFSSKYKNLPQKYHVYLDIIIKNKIGK
jgi:transcriptional regulator with GAF, ATPase, and Fis domain